MNCLVTLSRFIMISFVKIYYNFVTGSLHCVCCTDDGEVYTWGDNDEGQLGDGTTTAIQRPRVVAALKVCLLT